MSEADLAAAVEMRFYAVNGRHEMTEEDDAYATAWYVALEELAAASEYTSDELRRLMLANRLPLPSYIRSDGVQMVARDLLALVHEAGGVDCLPAWFASHWSSPAEAVLEWEDYMSGRYVCLRSVTPQNMKRKNELVETISGALANPMRSSEEWLERLHSDVDELEALEPPFAPYDRLRFGGPVSRDTLIDDSRRRFPRKGASTRASRR